MLSELKRTRALLDIPYGRRRGIVVHDTRHSAVTTSLPPGPGEAVAMTITGNADPSVFKRYNVRRDDVRADALTRRGICLATKRGTTPSVPAITRKARCSGHDRARQPRGILGARRAGCTWRNAKGGLEPTLILEFSDDSPQPDRQETPSTDTNCALGAI
jgi:hypothetical protein